MEKWREEWNSEDFGKAYGDLFYKRAVGDAPEMESSKAAANRMGRVVCAGDRVLDVGCGAGHYLRSMKQRVDVPFTYTGADATPYYVKVANQAHAGDDNVNFVQSDIFALDFEDSAFDVVMCNNVLLHLPSIRTPLAELCRVAKRHVMVRTLIASKSYIVQDVAPGEDGCDFDANDEPVGFHYLNIYSEAYVRHLLAQNPRVESVEIVRDTEFDANAISDTERLLPRAWDATRVEGAMQVSGMILQPWSWLDIALH
jgi:SAM-dependent methyltransferase